MKYSIVIPTYNHLDDHLKPCLESIYKNTDMGDAEIIVVANGCKDNTKQYVNSLGGNTRLIWFNDPLGYTRATNIGIQQARGEYTILLNNDTVILDFYPKNTWLQMLEAPMQGKAISGVSKLWFNPLTKHTVPEQGESGGWFIIFFCAMVQTALFDDIGLLDETFNPGVGEDVDFCLRAAKKGYTSVSVPVDQPATYYTAFPIWHKESGTFRHIENSANNYYRGMDLLTQRWNEGYYK